MARVMVFLACVLAASSNAQAQNERTWIYQFNNNEPSNPCYLQGETGDSHLFGRVAHLSRCERWGRDCWLHCG